MVVWPRKMSDASIDGVIWVTCAFCTELPNRPIIAMLVVEKLDQGIEWITVSEGRVCRAGAGGRDY